MTDERPEREAAKAELVEAHTRLNTQLEELRVLAHPERLPELWTVPGAANELAERTRAALDLAAQQLTILSCAGSYLCPQETK